MEEYTLGFPPEMNNKKYRKSIYEKEEFMVIRLDGTFKNKDNEITH